MRYIETPHAPPPGGHYAQAVVGGGIVSVSGQLPTGLGRDSTQAPFDAQVRQVFDQLFAILEATGTGPDRLLRLTVYIVGVENWPAFDRLCAEIMGRHRPARTVVPVAELHFGYLVEIDALALEGDAS